jgi:transposase InsO family protein
MATSSRMRPIANGRSKPRFRRCKASVESGAEGGDISYIWTHEGWLYLAVILDLHSRRVVGWAVSDRMKKDLAIRALDMAVNLRRPPKDCIFHSDRGRLVQ